MRPALLLFALALLIRLALGLALWHQGDTAYILSSDDGDAYVASARWAAFGNPIDLTPRLAQKWPGAESEDEDPTTRWPPAYWLFLAAQYRAIGYQHLSTIVLQSLLGAAAAVATFSIATRLLPKRWAFAAGLLVALSSTLIYESAALYAEALYIPLLVIALALMLQRTPLAAFAAGLTLGVAEATRPLALPVAVICVAWQREPRLMAATITGFTISLAPFAIPDPHLFTAGGAEALHDSLVQPLSLADRVEILFLTGGWAPLGEPLLPPAFRLLFWSTAIVGACTGLRRQPLLLLAVAAILLPALTVGLPLVRYRSPADPLFLIAFVCGVRTVRLLIHKLRPRGGYSWLNSKPSSRSSTALVEATSGKLPVWQPRSSPAAIVKWASRSHQ